MNNPCNSQTGPSVTLQHYITDDSSKVTGSQNT